MYTEIAERVYVIEGERQGRNPFSNSLLIDDGQTVLIDTGLGKDRLEQVLNDYTIDLVLLSHSHEDHVAGNPLFPTAEIAVHYLDAPAVRRVDHLVQLFGAAGSPTEKTIRRLLEELYQLRDSRIDRELRDGDHIETGSRRIDVIHTPGHSAGHCCYHLHSAGVIFLGDIDLSSFGPFYGHLDSDIDQFILSCKKIRSLDFDVAVPSHKEIFFGRANILERLDRYLKAIGERDAKIIDFLRSPKTLEEIVDTAVIYGKFVEPEDLYRLAEKIMIEKHLARLVKDNSVLLEHGYYRSQC